MIFAPFCSRRFYWQQVLPCLQSANRQRRITAGPRSVITRSDNNRRRHLCPPLMLVMASLNRGIATPRLRCLPSSLLSPSPCPGLPRRTSGSPHRTPGLPCRTRHSPNQASGSPRSTSGSPRLAQGLPHPLPRSLHRLPGCRILYPITTILLTSVPICLHYLTPSPLYRVFPSTGLQSRFHPNPSLFFFRSGYFHPRLSLTRNRISTGSRNPISIRRHSTPLFLPHIPELIFPHTHPLLHNPSGMPQQRLAHHHPDTDPSHHSSRRQPTKIAEPGALHPGDRHAFIKHRPHERPSLLRRRYSYRTVLRRKK